MNWSLLGKENPIIQSVVNDWNDLLEKKLNEHQYHSFIKKHANLFFTNSYDSFFAISKLKLGSDLETDFAVPTDERSLGLTWNLIEIKTPQARVYTNKGTPSETLFKAIDQVSKWKYWLSKNRYEAEKLFHSNGVRVSKNPNFKFTIIIGRRKETEKYLVQRNNLITGPDVTIRSFDYLSDLLKKKYFPDLVMLLDGNWDDHHQEERNKLANQFIEAFTDSQWKKIQKEPEVTLPHFTRQSASVLIKYMKINKERLDSFCNWEEK